MWNYEKKLQFPINIKTPDAKTAKIIMSQYGGPDGEISASLRYLSQRFSMPDGKLIGLLTDVGTEEMAHMEMVGSIVYQLTRNLTEKQIEDQGFSDYYTDHGLGIWPQSAGGIPNNALTYASKGDVIADLVEDLAADGAIA